ncbi:MAG: purine-binding chemotaxis protein CheW [Opitutaceae bacterium]|nr:purine-binding chemotaxis protein CheW [Opitutaceae bacterium]
MSLPAETTAAAGRYLTVLAADEAYGVPVLKVREIIRLQKITPVPQVPEHIKGVINLRGRVIPVVDLRVKFGLRGEFTERTCIVVVQVFLEGSGEVPMGLIVDSVEEVVNLGADQIEPTPAFGTQIDTAYISGMAKVNGQVKTLLDLDRVINADALRRLQQAANAG